MFRLLPAARTPGDGDGRVVAAGLMAGKRPDALPAPMSELETPFRLGRGPSGTVLPIGAAAPTGVLEDDDAAREAWAAMTATVSCAAGGVHLAWVTTLAVAVSVTRSPTVAAVRTEAAEISSSLWPVGRVPTVQTSPLDLGHTVNRGASTFATLPMPTVTLTPLASVTALQIKIS